MRLLVCFDISDDKIRLQLVKLLDSYGKRCQFSIFEMNINNTLFIQFKKDLDKIVFEKTDKVFIYPIPEEFGKKILRIGPYLAEEEVIVI
jgi:CRISPR-associated protein Cas2